MSGTSIVARIRGVKTDASNNWSRMPAANIPSKPNLHWLFLETLETTSKIQKEKGASSLRVLDMGCGDGRLACDLQRGLLVPMALPVEMVGLDIYTEAIALANSTAASTCSSPPSFFVADTAEDTWTDNSKHGLVHKIMGVPPQVQVQISRLQSVV